MIPNINIPYYEDKRLQNQNSQHKKELKQEIHRAFNEGQLYFRKINPAYETIYLTQKNKDPRPVFLVAPKTPIEMRYKDDGLVTVGIINNKTLFSYKQNASTNTIVDGGGPDIYENNKHYKCLTDSKALLSKQYELASRRWEVYQIATSGHLQVDGNFSLPKFKENIASDYIIPHSEEIKSEYNLEDIKCYCIELYSNQKIIDIITTKKQLEKKLNLTDLPILLYSEKHGTIKIIFEENINIEQLKQNENTIDYLSLLCEVDILNNLKYMLPIDSRITAISNLSIADEILQDADLSYKILLNDKLLKLVNHFTEYNVTDLRELFSQGANAKLEVPFYNNQYHSLADTLMIAIFNSDIENNPVISKKASEMLNELFINGAYCCNASSSPLIFMILLEENVEIINTCAASSILLDNIRLKYIHMEVQNAGFMSSSI